MAELNIQDVVDTFQGELGRLSGQLLIAKLEVSAEQQLAKNAAQEWFERQQAYEQRIADLEAQLPGVDHQEVVQNIAAGPVPPAAAMSDAMRRKKTRRPPQ